jgi:hypothetical protein
LFHRQAEARDDEPQPADVVDAGSGPVSEATTSEKRKRGQRRTSRYPTGTYVITEVSSVGEPLQPRDNSAKFRTAVGAVVRDELNPAIKSWPEVPAGTKVYLWDKLQKNFKVPKGTERQVEHWAMKAMGEAFRRWRSRLNTEYAQKGLTPFKQFGKITPGQWEQFLAQKTTEQAQTQSAKYKELAKKNVHPHRLGTGGYAGKEAHFRKLEQEAIEKGTYTMDGVPVRGRNWTLARNEQAVSSLDTFEKAETGEAAKKMVKLAEDKKKGLFTPLREKDELTIALGTAEHTGRVRGKGKQVIWKEGWEEDKDKYRKRPKKVDIDKIVADKVAEAVEKSRHRQDSGRQSGRSGRKSHGRHGRARHAVAGRTAEFAAGKSPKQRGFLSR